MRFFFLVLSLSFFFRSPSIALDTAIYSSRDWDAGPLAARPLGGGAQAPPPLPPPTPPPLLPPSNTNNNNNASSLLFSSAPSPVLLGRYDPCSEPGPATKGRALYLGLALWPGGTPEAWGPATSFSSSSTSSAAANDEASSTSLNPCRLAARVSVPEGAPLPSAATTLAAAGVVIAPFAVRIDSVAALGIGGLLQRRLLALAAEAADKAAAASSGGESSSSSASPVVSAVLFRGTRIRSEARIVASADSGVSFGTVFVQALAAEVVFGKKRKKEKKEKVDKEVKKEISKSFF